MGNLLVYIGVFFLFLSYVKVPSNPRMGWLFGVIGNLLYIFAFLPYGKMELLVAPILFAALSAWNLWKELHKMSSN
jgi:hypothetical protein